MNEYQMHKNRYNVAVLVRRRPLFERIRYMTQSRTTMDVKIWMDNIAAPAPMISRQAHNSSVDNQLIDQLEEKVVDITPTPKTFVPWRSLWTRKDCSLDMEIIRSLRRKTGGKDLKGGDHVMEDDTHKACTTSNLLERWPEHTNGHAENLVLSVPTRPHCPHISRGRNILLCIPQFVLRRGLRDVGLP